MKIITWNCNLKFKQKFELISSYDPDICFVQECENLNTTSFLVISSFGLEETRTRDWGF